MPEQIFHRRTWILLLAVAAVPSVLAVVQLGRIHPDEVYQTLEPAYFRAHGYGVLAWEWRVGIRNWAVPLLFSQLLGGCELLGIRNPRAYRAVLEIPQYALQVWMLAATFRYAYRRVGEVGGRWAVLAVGLYGPVLVFAGRTLGESFSAAFLLVALERLDRTERIGRDAFLGGLALGLAFVTRYGSAVFIAAVFAWLLVRRRWRALIWTGAGGALVLLGLGALDWATWGRPFHSFLGYARFNLLSSGAVEAFGALPASYYLPVLAIAIPLWAWPGIALAIKRERPRVSLWLFCASTYLVTLACTPHKEQRFIYPALVLIAFGAAPEVFRVLREIQNPHLRRSLLIAACGVGFAVCLFPTELTAKRAGQFQAIVKATRSPQATGLLIVNEGLWGAGGYFYIGKNIPWLTCDTPADGAFQLAMRDLRFNRAVAYEERAVSEMQSAGFRVVDRVGRATILARP